MPFLKVFIFNFISIFFLKQETLSIGALPSSRFLLATLGLLVAEHYSNSLSLLLNSGVLALTQSILRLTGSVRKDFYIIWFLPK